MASKKSLLEDDDDIEFDDDDVEELTGKKGKAVFAKATKKSKLDDDDDEDETPKTRKAAPAKSAKKSKLDDDDDDFDGNEDADSDAFDDDDEDEAPKAATAVARTVGKSLPAKSATPASDVASVVDLVKTGFKAQADLLETLIEHVKKQNGGNGNGKNALGEWIVDTLKKRGEGQRFSSTDIATVLAGKIAKGSPDHMAALCAAIEQSAKASGCSVKGNLISVG